VCYVLLLFLLYINDLVDGFAKLDCSIISYADDAKLYSLFKVGDYSPALDEALEYITKLAGIWQLQIANSKCFAHIISMVTSASTYNYRINDYKLQWSSCMRDLGIYVDNDLKFAQYISKITHIGHSRAALILKCFITCDPVVLIKAYCTYVRPILVYCTPVWSPHHRGLNNKLENVQRRFTKRINGLSCLTYEDRLVHLKLDSLHVRRIKQDMIMCY